jgi:uncharacterized protein (DUF2236 family)
MVTKALTEELLVNLIGERIRRITGSVGSLDVFMQPMGDPGLLGPDSMAWRVHEDLTVMMVGGLSSLIIQCLHPRALAAVWDHSDFRHNLRARLGRTAYFVALTTYAAEPVALKAIERVNAIHAKVRGLDLQGQPYTANEPDLIRWVHLAEITSFLAAYQHLALQPLTAAQCDQYIREMSRIGGLLGAGDLPVTLQAANAALLDYQPALRFDARAQEILRIIEAYPTDLLDRPFIALVLKSAMDVMPPWVLSLIGRQPVCALQSQATRLALQTASLPIQWMIRKSGVSAIARERLKVA